RCARWINRIELACGRRRLSGIAVRVHEVSMAPIASFVRATEPQSAPAVAGADILVVTAQPHYPAWKLFPGYDKPGVVRDQRNGVLIDRVRPRVPARM